MKKISLNNFWPEAKYFFRGLIKGQDNPPDWTLIGIIGFLTLFGLIMLSSAAVALGFERYGDSYWNVKHQIFFGLFPGIALFIFFSRFDYCKLKKLAIPFLFGTIILLALVFIPGIGADWGTARSWIKFFGFSLQPSEIVKLTFLLYLVSWLSSRESRHLKNLQSGFLPFVFILAVIVLLLVLQPDTGTMIIIAVTSLIVYFVAGGSKLHLSWLAGAGLAGLWLLVKTSPYRAERLTTFLHPELDPLNKGYHINQALLAVGSGGWFGKGFGHSRQKFAYLPEVAGDSIFAVIAEELGFFLSVLVVFAFLFLFWRGLKLAKNCQDPFGRLLVVGIISWFVFQAFFNIGAISGILPLTGIPLPFISYGGTALMTCLAAAGILVNISKQTKTE